MGFPETKFGRCQKCGHSGKDDDDDSIESGYELKFKNGLWLGPVCYAEADDSFQDLLKREQDIDGQKLRESAGFTK